METLLRFLRDRVTLCLSEALSCVNFIDVIMGDIPDSMPTWAMKITVNLIDIVLDTFKVFFSINMINRKVIRTRHTEAHVFSDDEDSPS